MIANAFESHRSPNPHTPTEQQFYPNNTFLFPIFFSVRPKRENRTVWSPLPQPILPLEIKEITERGKQMNEKQKLKKTVKENQHSSK